MSCPLFHFDCLAKCIFIDFLLDLKKKACLSGLGPMPWTINSEIYPLWARSTGNACSAGVNWTFNVLVSLTFLHIAQYLTYYGTIIIKNLKNRPPEPKSMCLLITLINLHLKLRKIIRHHLHQVTGLLMKYCPCFDSSPLRF